MVNLTLNNHQSSIVKNHSRQQPQQSTDSARFFKSCEMNSNNDCNDNDNDNNNIHLTDYPVLITNYKGMDYLLYISLS